MSFSVSRSANFANIDWSTLEGRPPIDPQHFCTEQNWYQRVPCCMDGFAVEHVLHAAHNNGYEIGRGEGVAGSPAVGFISQYPCLNGPELDAFFERFSSSRAAQPSSRSINAKGILISLLDGIKKFFN